MVGLKSSFRCVDFLVILGGPIWLVAWQATKYYEFEHLPEPVNFKEDKENITSKTNKEESDSKSELDLKPKAVDDVGEYESIFIIAVLNASNNLSQIKFNNNCFIPREIFKIIYLMIPFHEELTTIYINRGLNKEVVYELKKVIVVSQITEVILDNSKFKEANYHYLLENTCLKYLSLSRCGLGNDVVKELALRLEPPLSASKTLTALTLSSNNITDVGATYLGDMLRSNRKLAYLNLAGNRITDKGAECIMKTLMEFPLNSDEIEDLIAKRSTDLKTKNMMMKEMKEDTTKVESVQSGLVKKKVDLKKVKSFAALMIQQNKGLRSTFNIPDTDDAKAQDEEITNAFSSENLIQLDGIVHCLGNNVLCYFNLAYNNLTCWSLKILLTVLQTQVNLNRKPRGLVNVCIDGNDIQYCNELSTISFILETGLEQLVNVVKDKNKKPLIKSKQKSNIVG